MTVTITQISFRTLYSLWAVLFFKAIIFFSLYCFSNQDTQFEEKENADSCNKVEKNQIPVKEAVSPLARIEDEEHEEEEGMKLRGRSKIKVTVLSFDLALFCTSVWLYSALIYWQFFFLVLTAWEKIQVVGMVNDTPSKTKAAKIRVSQYYGELCARRSSSYRAIYLSMHSSVLLLFRPSV